VRSNKVVWILGSSESAGIDDVDVGTSTSSCGLFDCAGGGCPARIVVVEAEGDAVDPAVVKKFECVGVDGGSTKGGDVVDSMGAQLVEVEDAFDEDQISLGLTGPSQ
jgi:hypothetical protein